MDRRADRYARTIFFFQAEDGIRYRTVTGVQTCALPISADMHVDRARAFVKLGQWEQAETDYSRALQLKPGDADLRIERAGFYEQRGQADKAAADLEDRKSVCRERE